MKCSHVELFFDSLYDYCPVVDFSEFAVWRWIPPAVDGAKVWQGQAFGENTTALRSRHRSSVPQNPLTTCLKIRNMFDAAVETGTEWQQTVKDAVLEKCSPATIVHVAVDSSSTEGCVYVRLVCGVCLCQIFSHQLSVSFLVTSLLMHHFHEIVVSC